MNEYWKTEDEIGNRIRRERFFVRLETKILVRQPMIRATHFLEKSNVRGRATEGHPSQQRKLLQNIDIADIRQLRLFLLFNRCDGRRRHEVEDARGPLLL